MNTAMMSRKFRMDPFSFVYFLCSDCQLVHIDRRRIRALAASWRREKESTRSIPFRVIYADVQRFLEKIEQYLHSIGYRHARFIETTPPP